MAKCAFLITDLGSGITRTSGTSISAGAPITNLNDPQPRIRTYFTATTAEIIVDLGSAKAFDCAALIGLTNVSTVQFMANSANSWGAPAYDSGAQSGAIDTAQPSANAIWCTTAAITYRYARWALTGTNPMSVGLAPIGALFRPTRNFAYGGPEGYVDFSVRDVNPDTGASFGLSLSRLRRKIITLPGLTKTEVRSSLQTLDMTIGAGGDVLYVEDPAATWLERSTNSIWGSYRAPGGNDMAARQNFVTHARTFIMTERA